MRIILLSGGADSTLLAHRHRDTANIICAFVNYGQPAAREEMKAAMAIAARCKLPIRVLLSAIGCHRMRTGPGITGPRESPGRNLALLALVASHYPDSELLIGCNSDDARDYPDCRPGFIVATNVVLSLCCNARVSAPLIELDKGQIMEELPESLWGLCWTCYQPEDGKPCGTCNSCIEAAISQLPF